MNDDLSMRELLSRLERRIQIHKEREKVFPYKKKLLSKRC